MNKLNRKQRDELIKTNLAEIESLKIRLQEIDGLEVITEEIDDEYYRAHSKQKALQHEVFLLGQPIRNICRNTQDLVSANID